MATSIIHEKTFVETLKSLMALDFDAAAAYEAAVNRIDDGVAKDRLGEFMSDHQRHTQEIGRIVRDLGEEPPTTGDFQAVLTQGKVVIGNMAGDKGILLAMKSNEDDTNKAYEQALLRTDLPSHIRSLLAGNLADERRHRAWIEQRLENFS